MAYKLTELGSQESGLLIYEDMSDVLIKKTYLRYEKRDLPLYEEKFENLIDDGIIASNSRFEEHVWRAFGEHHFVTFDFANFEYNQELYWSLKCFVVVQLHDRRMAVDSVKSGLNNIYTVIEITSSYDKRLFNQLDEWKNIKLTESKQALVHYKNSNLAFLYFNPINDADEYIDFFHAIVGKIAVEVREIPTYSNFIQFDEIIHDFMNKATQDSRSKYYPIYIWWRLTSIIPIRPVEFVDIRNKSIRYDSIDDEYYIKIPRKKQKPNKKSSSKKVPIKEELKITKEIYEIIDDYRRTAKIQEEDSLFPLSHYRKSLSKVEASMVSTHYEDHMSYGQMTKLLDQFLDEIVQKQYGIKVVQTREELSVDNPHTTMRHFNLMDTRHLAICGMMMQGFSELTIAQMAGHQKITTQAHYSAHIDDFQRSYSGLLSKEIMRKMTDLRDNSGLNSFTFRQKQLLSYQNQKRDNSKTRKIDFGYCHSDNFPNECYVKDCLFCNKFQIDLQNLSNQERAELKGKITIVQDEIQVKLDFIKKYYRMAYKKDESFEEDNIKSSKELEQNAISLGVLTNREAMLIAHLMKSKEVNEDA